MLRQTPGTSTYEILTAFEIQATEFAYLTRDNGSEAWIFSGSLTGPDAKKDLSSYTFGYCDKDGNQRSTYGGFYLDPGKIIASPIIGTIGDGSTCFLFRRTAPNAAPPTQAELKTAVDAANAWLQGIVPPEAMKALLEKKAKKTPNKPRGDIPLTPENSRLIPGPDPAVTAFCAAPVQQRLEEYPEFLAARDKTGFAVQALEGLLQSPQPESLPYLFKLQQIVTFIQGLPREAVDKKDVPALAYYLVNTLRTGHAPLLPVGGASLEALQTGTLENFTAPYLKEQVKPWKEFWQREAIFLFAQYQAEKLQEKLPPGWYAAEISVAHADNRLYVASSAALAVEAGKPCTVSAKVGDEIFMFTGTPNEKTDETLLLSGEFSLINPVAQRKHSACAKVYSGKTPYSASWASMGPTDAKEPRISHGFFVLHVPPGPHLTLIWAERSTKDGAYRIVFAKKLPTKADFSEGELGNGKILSVSGRYQWGFPIKALELTADVTDPKIEMRSRVSRESSIKFLLGRPDGLFPMGSVKSVFASASDESAQDITRDNIWLMQQSADEAPLPTSAEIEKALAAAISAKTSAGKHRLPLGADDVLQTQQNPWANPPATTP